MRKALLAIWMLLWLCAPAFAQTGAWVSVEIQTYAPGVNPATGQPVQRDSFPLSAGQCNQAPLPIPTTVVFNPRLVQINDPVNPGRACLFDRGTVLMGLPVVPGEYRSTATATDDRGLTSPRSAASNPFGRVNEPSAPAGVAVVPSP